MLNPAFNICNMFKANLQIDVTHAETWNYQTSFIAVITEKNKYVVTLHEIFEMRRIKHAFRRAVPTHVLLPLSSEGCWDCESPCPRSWQCLWTLACDYVLFANNEAWADGGWPGSPWEKEVDSLLLSIKLPGRKWQSFNFFSSVLQLDWHVLKQVTTFIMIENLNSTAIYFPFKYFSQFPFKSQN